MVVAVQRGLENIKQRLRNKGYDVVTFGEYNYPIDALVYTGDSFETLSINNNNIPNLTSHTLGLGDNNRSYGVLLVNANHKSVDEIDTILKRRVYSPIF